MLDATPDTLRAAIRAATRAPEDALVARLADAAALDAAARAAISAEAADLVRAMRAEAETGLMESFLAEYGLSTSEGLALMCLAEALLRVPDAPTVDALIADKVAGGDWAAHFGHSASRLVNASTLGLALTGRVLGTEEARGTLNGAARRLGQPVIRAATRRAMREMGTQFVLGEDIGAALRRARPDVARGVTHSYDMLGEAAMTQADADAFRAAYEAAIDALADEGEGEVDRRPGISVKLSALHPRYEASQRDRVMAELAPILADLAARAAAAKIGLMVDAEEADRLDLSLDVIDAALSDPRLAGWAGFGVVVQAYGKRALPVIDWLEARAKGRRICVRLVKGAYWDAEIKRAQVEGLPGFPVFTRKAATDVSYLACARRLLAAPGLYPQFATHNAHSMVAIHRMAREAGRTDWEFQRLHGMGEAMHATARARWGTRLRVYAPVGRHRDLLAYLVRRLLENGANSSFVNKVSDPDVPPEEVVADPFGPAAVPARGIASPADLFGARRNSRGWDLHDPSDLAALEAARAPHRAATWAAGPILAAGSDAAAGDAATPVENPADPSDAVGTVRPATVAEVDAAFAAAAPWDAPAAARADVLRRAADLYEAGSGEAFALLAREAGKGLKDAVAEMREAVDFLRYYADHATDEGAPLGTVACISPWNFPLAIFTGQIAGALAAGNAVLAKPAEPTPLIAAFATRLLHEAGVPRAALQLLPGGPEVGAALTGDPRLAGTAFTGSTPTAKIIDRAMAGAAPLAPLVAETGGINAMVVDSTALPEQVVRDLLASAFQSAGQRCSAARIVYLQEDVAPGILEMLTGAMRELRMGDPWDEATDVGPIITAAARADIAAHVERAAAEGRLIARHPGSGPGHALAPAILRVEGIAEVEREVFGPVLHVATFPAGGLDAVVDAVNARGFGLTFGLHSRIERVARRVAERARVGNVYVNRNQIGAVVGSQPFGGEARSGTGPKAGGPAYVARFRKGVHFRPETGALPGPTGERNHLSRHPRGPVLCLGPGAAAAERQVEVVRAAGGVPVLPSGSIPDDVAAVAWWGDAAGARAARAELAGRTGPIVPWMTDPGLALSTVERHVCTDTTAAGGNATLLGAEGR
ncbi:bifunctional proline dehydrogenase/L-glutamate gamma-semialdehyde dehydrogenase PutA [Jannaschia sp. Os4]|uniref:bifunctional proline dehydrogenase/L-glutamate gamma-semialdehyde dehydrogenase PutA n=1 Tax=Jannaschia sp. Os4 TaxID=2807617 RepID=UPI00193AC7BE|nr:bifunctional proline dehydrogenase/L-glutamate gamma-semialdehyde dehydrogenase PutA [Jannaschia sp. Os4]MBM2576579.1 bifunctional proline dehydrogenase/L-glutamate gamma-semialdehyde dehydrogenase PutA [Jannaschia sp. Os4]